MTKKQKSRNRRRAHKKATAHGTSEEAHRGHGSPSAPFVHISAADSENAPSSPRHNHPHDSRRHAHGSRAPLTNRNLQTLLEQSGPPRRPVALDMDQYARDQDHYGKPYESDDISIYSHRSSESLEFGESNPSSDHSSDSTSLDDVCFPDYYEGLRDTAESVWPDLRILEEFIVEEQDDLKEAMDEVPSGVNFQYPVARKVSSLGDGYSAQNETDDGQYRGQSDRYRPERGVPRNASAFDRTDKFDIDVSPTEECPLLNSVQVDESTSVKSAGSSLRVRPRPIQPWEKSREQVPTILNNKKNVEATYRFTYFREDIEGTIHAPTLSGLVTENEANMSNEQILSKLHFLFSPGGSPLVPNASEATETPSNQSNLGNLPNPSNLGNGLLSHSRNLSQKLDSPMPASVSEQHSESIMETSHVAPFWLDVTDPSEEEMKVLSKTFGLHPLTTEDIFLGETREKVELFRSYYFICFTSFDIVYERRKQRKMEHEKKLTKMSEYDPDKTGLLKMARKLFGDDSKNSKLSSKMSVSTVSKNNRIRSGELCPLNMYMIIFETGVLTFHFNATPHPINVRRRARMLKDHLTVSTDWICYALIDDITDSFAPMIDSIEQEVYNIEDEIMKMHSGDTSDDSDDDSDEEILEEPRKTQKHPSDVFYRRQRSKSVVEAPQPSQFLRNRSKRGSRAEMTLGSGASTNRTVSSSSKSTSSKIVAWKRKGDMLRRIGECRKRVMSVMRLLGTKADVIKGFSKRFSENEVISNPRGPLDSRNNRLASKQEILMYLGDIQDHIVTMVQSLNHYEKLLARSHSNYLAQLNIDMTKVNNDTNDILGKVTILGTIVLPINVVTGLWGMNCIVPGQDYDGLMWFNGIVAAISVFSILCYIYARKVTGL